MTNPDEIDAVEFETPSSPLQVLPPILMKIEASTFLRHRRVHEEELSRDCGRDSLLPS